jgi:glycerophosphoryl diester phosphodiesterase
MNNPVIVRRSEFLFCTLWALLIGCLLTAPLIAADPKLIAHRGGVVDEERIENNFSSLEGAVERGYWMVEIDIRRSRDGRPVIHHDQDFERFYGVPSRVSELTWAEIRRLRSTTTNEPPRDLSEFAAACRGRIRLMLDVKGSGYPDEYYRTMENILRENDLLETTILIGGAESKAYFRGRGPRVSAGQDEIEAARERREDVSQLYFMFLLGSLIDEKTVEFARSADVKLVAAINTFRYPPESYLDEGEADIRRLLGLGVRYYQIDSVYDRWLLPEVDR